MKAESKPSARAAPADTPQHRINAASKRVRIGFSGRSKCEVIGQTVATKVQSDAQPRLLQRRKNSALSAVTDQPGGRIFFKYP
jgi:hypothetical protein